MAKLIKFPLEMANGTKVRTLEELQEHYDIASVIKYYKDGRLLRWLKANYQDEIAENLQESEKQSLRNIFSVLELPEPSDEDLKNVDLRNISDTENSTATENENLKAEIKKHFKDASQLDDWKIFQNESDTKDKCVVEFENEKLQTGTNKTFEKGENFANDVADFLTKLIDFHTKPTVFQSTENIKVGDIAYSDGSVSEEYDRNKTPVGIVIEVTNGTAAKIVSLDETEAEWGTAKKWCNNYTDASGSRDWHLPTKEELNQLYEAKDEVNVAIKKIIIGEGARKKRNDLLLFSLDDLLKEDIVKKIGSDVYWSSSKYSGNYVWIQHFSNGYQGGDLSKSLSNSVRAVRAF